MPSIYVHLSGRDVDAALLKLQGEKIEEAKERTKLVKKKLRAMRRGKCTNV
jgi:hypothetical protein